MSEQIIPHYLSFTQILTFLSTVLSATIFQHICTY